MQKKRNTRSESNSQKVFKPIDIIILIICVCGFAGASYLFYKDINISLSKKNEKPIAVLYLKYNTVQRRFKDRNLWEQLKQSAPLYDGDRIRTASLSEAQTVFEDGSKIDLHENTLVQVFADNNKNTLNFIKGSVSISSGVSEDKFVIQTGNNELVFEKNTTAVIKLPEREKQNATIAVTAGTLSVKEVQ